MIKNICKTPTAKLYLIKDNVFSTIIGNKERMAALISFFLKYIWKGTSPRKLKKKTTILTKNIVEEIFYLI